jgi:hypothetical protein
MLELRIEEVDRYRDMECPAYEQCLVLAARKRWHSFTCRRCERFIELRGVAAILAITPVTVDPAEPIAPLDTLEAVLEA